MAPNNTPMIVGPISVNTFGVTSPTKLTADQITKNKAAAEKRKAQEDKAKKSIPSSAPKARGTGKEAGFLGFERGVKGTFAQAPSQTGKVKKSKDQIEKELDAALSKNNKQTTKSTTKTTPSKSSSSGSFKRPSFTKSSGGYTRKYTGGR